MRSIRYAVVACLAAVAVQPAAAATSYLLTVSTFGPIGVSSITSVSSGGISCGAGGVACSSYFGAGSTVSLAMYQPAASTTAFAGWGGDGCASNSPSCSVVMDAARTVTAKFNPVLSVRLFGNGLGTVISTAASVSCAYTSGCANGASVTSSFSSGTVIVLTSSAATNSTFTGWTGVGSCGTASTCTVTMSQYQAVIATFTSAGPFEILLVKSGSGEGTVTSSPVGISCGGTCASTFTALASITLTPVASTGSYFAGWANAGCSGTTTCVVISTSAQQSLGGIYSPAAYFYLDE